MRRPGQKILLPLLVLLFLSVPLPPRNCPAETEVYFSPDGGIRDRIIRAINLTKSSIDSAIFNFTSGELAHSIVKAKERGVKIRIIVDREKAGGRLSEIGFLMNNGVAVKMLKGKGRGIMHNKFAIYDDKLVLTGSYNWIERAEKFNYENVIVIDEPEVVKKYKGEFEKLWSHSIQ